MTAVDSIQLERLDVDNYATWRRRMKFLLITKGLWTAVTGESIDPEKDLKAQALIGLYVKDHHLAELERCDSAKKAWEQLESIYQAKSNSRKRQRRKELSQLKMGAAEPLTKYVARAREIQNQLRAAGHEVTDQEVAWSVLAGLLPHYETVVTVLETSTDRDISLDDILPKLMTVEQRQTAECEIPEETALTAKRGKQFQHKQRFGEQRTCYMCGRIGHIAKDCPEKRNKRHSSAPAYHFSAIAL